MNVFSTIIKFAKDHKNIFMGIVIIIIFAGSFLLGRCTAGPGTDTAKLTELQKQLTEISGQYRTGIDQLSERLGRIEENNTRIKQAIDNSIRAIESSIRLSDSISSTNSSAEGHIGAAIKLLQQLRAEIKRIK